MEPLSNFSKRKLTELADIIERADKKYARWRKAGKQSVRGARFGYDQAEFTHECGTPACAYGHWLSVHPKDKSREWSAPFRISHTQSSTLFRADGCGSAGRSAKKAVAFIRKAVKEGQL